jgi:hypothetical protein
MAGKRVRHVSLSVDFDAWIPSPRDKNPEHGSAHHERRFASQVVRQGDNRSAIFVKKAEAPRRATNYVDLCVKNDAWFSISIDHSDGL